MFSVGNTPNDNLTPVVPLADTEIDLFQKECESSQEIDVNLDSEIVDVETIFSTNHEETDEITLPAHITWGAHTLIFIIFVDTEKSSVLMVHTKKKS